MPTNTLLPEKFRGELRRKCWDDHAAALDALLDATAALCPRATLQSQERYTALYKGRSIFAYIEPRRDGILFGFFRDYVDRVSQQLTIHETSFPEWNKSKGGLVGYLL